MEIMITLNVEVMLSDAVVEFFLYELAADGDSFEAEMSESCS